MTFAHAFIFCAIAASASVAHCADYYLLRPIPSQQRAATSPPIPPEITLQPGALPDAVETKPYSFDFKSLTQIKGGAGIENAIYSLAVGSLPAGLSLRSDGIISGVPAGQTPASGVDFAVQGLYGSASGQNSYTLKVGEIALESVAIAAGSGHTCALTAAGAVKCWGNNSAGQLGNGLFANSSVPVDVIGLGQGVTSVAAGGGTVCAVQYGSLKCWGANTSGQVGNGTSTNVATPQQVPGMESGISAVAVGALSTCAVKGGGVFCWGKNDTGQLGNGTNTNSLTPVAVSGLSSSVTALAGTSNHTCAIHSGAAKCWGVNTYGQIGDGTTVFTWVTTPTQVVGVEAGATALAAGSQHSCVVQAGSAKCWGQGGNGQLGDGALALRTTPVQAAGLTTGVTAISAGSSTSCAVQSGAMQCWGLGVSGQIGNGATTTNVATPAPVLGLPSAPTSISVGGSHTCSVSSGFAKCWGSALFGRLGNGTTSGKFSDTSVCKTLKPPQDEGALPPRIMARGAYRHLAVDRSAHW